MPNPLKIEVRPGEKYGKLTIVEESKKHIQPSGQTARMFLCKCECGNNATVRLIHLRKGRVKSCGCLAGTCNIDVESPLFNVWRGMRNRCRSENYVDAHRYKKRGIVVCEEWDKDFRAFESWALVNGYEKGLELDRRENDGNYEPSNCRFVTGVVNVNNREITMMVNYCGECKAIGIILREKGLHDHFSTIRCRINRGWSPQKAIDTPIRKGNYRSSIASTPALS